MHTLNMRHPVSAILTVLAFTVAAIGGFLNFRGASFMLGGGTVAIAVACAAVVAELVKPFWLTGLSIAGASRKWGAALGIIVLGVSLHAFSLICAVGITASEHSALTDARGDLQKKQARAEAALTDAQVRTRALSGKRPAGEVRSDIAVAEAEVSRQAAREAAERTSTCGSRCQEAIAKGDAAKAKAAALEVELALSVQAEQAQQDLQAARQKLDGIHAPSAADPQAEALAAYLPVSVDQLTKGLPLLPSLLVEFGPVLTLLLASVFSGTSGQHERAPQLGEATVLVEEKLTEAQAQKLLYRLLILIQEAGGRWRGQNRAAEELGVSASSLSEALIKRWRPAGYINIEKDGTAHYLLLGPKAREKVRC